MRKETEMDVHIENLSDLFKGQEIVDRKKNELRKIMPMLRGMLPQKWSMTPIPIMIGMKTHDDCLRLEKYGEHWSSGSELCLMYWFTGGSQVCSSNKCDMVEALLCNGFSLNDVLAVHAAFPAALTELVRQIPELGPKLKTFLDQAKRG